MSLTEKDTRTEHRVQRPKRYVVQFYNDDFTPMEFVIFVLVEYFKQSLDEAEQITLTIHKTGKHTLGPYTHEVAENRVMLTMDKARAFQHPFLCEIKEA